MSLLVLFNQAAGAAPGPTTTLAPATLRAVSAPVGQLVGVSDLVEELIGASPNMTQVVLLRDDFMDLNGVSLNAHNMLVGSGWVENDGDFDIQSNRANLVSTLLSSFGMATADAGEDDAACEVVVNCLSADTGILFRFLNTDNFWLFAVEPPNAVKLYSRVAGVFTEHAAAAPVVSTGVDATLKVIASGNLFFCYVNNVFQFLHSATAPGTGRNRWGILGSGGGDRFDNFLVYTMVGGPTDVVTGSAGGGEN